MQTTNPGAVVGASSLKGKTLTPPKKRDITLDDREDDRLSLARNGVNFRCLRIPDAVVCNIVQGYVE